MGERKALNKYYPPDFDPERLVKRYKAREKQDNVRMMMPMTVRCNVCNYYAYIGTKFNMRKETVHDEDYLGIKIYRFYFKCVQCYGEITFKTDPKNHDYVVEKGAKRNYEPWRDALMAQQTLRELRENEEEGNTMKFLENKTYDSKREMEIMDTLDEIRSLQKRQGKVTYQQLVQAVFDAELRKQEAEEKEDEEIIMEKLGLTKKVKRIEEEDSPQNENEGKEGKEEKEKKEEKLKLPIFPIPNEKPEIKNKKFKISFKPIQKEKAKVSSNLINYSSSSDSETS